MDRLNQVKEDFKARNSFDELVTKEECKISIQNYDWLIEQAELVEELEDEIVKSDEKTNSMVSEISGLKEKVAELEKEREGFKEFLKNSFDLDKRIDSVPMVNIPEPFHSTIEKQQEKIEELERLVEKERNGQDWLLKKWQQAEKEIEEHCETKGKLGKQVFALTKLVDEQRVKIEQLNDSAIKVRQFATKDIMELEKENENLKQYKKVLMENSVVRSERIEELERMLEKERNMINYLVKHHLSGNVYTFERFVEYGRLYAMDKSKDGNIVNGVPWSFKLNGNAVTHENDECYLVQTKIGFEKFTPKDLIVITPNGQLSIIKFSQSEE